MTLNSLDRYVRDMAKNESLARKVMLLCLGTAIVSLAVHWRITTTVGYLAKAKSHPEFSYRHTSQGVVGEIALGAQIPTSPSRSRKINIAENVHWVGSGVRQSPVVSSGPKSADTFKASNIQVVVVLSDRRVYVYRHNEVIASYPIAVGKKGWETPTGNFQVMHMQHKPVWRHPITGQVFAPGSGSPLGDRWIGFWSDGRDEIGFHGTPEIDLVGTAVSHGCLRMRNADVRLLYNQVSIGTPVLVRK